MTGSYPDAPGMMIQYDRDGDAMYYDGGWVTMDSTQRANLNKTPSATAYTTTVNATNYICIVLPETYDLVGYSNASAGGTGNNIVETSVDTTNGIDGTWVTRGSFATNGFRSPTTVSWAGIKGIRWSHFNGVTPKTAYYGVHIYGQPSSAALTAIPSRLRFWHPTLNQLLGGADLDFGDLPKLDVGTKAFRIKNNSTTLTANGVVVSSESLNDATPPITGVQVFDNAGSGYASTQNIGNLAPGTISGLITLKTSPTINAIVGTWRQRVKAIATNWS